MWGWVIDSTPQLFFPWERALVPTTAEIAWALGPIWTGVENRNITSRTEFRVLNCPLRSEWLYRLHYRDPQNMLQILLICQRKEEFVTCFRGSTFVYYTLVYPYILVLLLIGNTGKPKT